MVTLIIIYTALMFQCYANENDKNYNILQMLAATVVYM